MTNNVQNDMLRCGRKPFLASDNMSNAHQAIVNHVCKVIGGKAVALEKDLSEGGGVATEIGVSM